MDEYLLRTYVMREKFFQKIDVLYFKAAISLGVAWSEIDALSVPSALHIYDRREDLKSVVVCWRDVSSAIFNMSTYASPDMFVNHIKFSFSQFVIYQSLGSAFVCMRILTGTLPSCLINLSQQWSWQLYEWCVIFSDAWLFLVAIKDNRSCWRMLKSAYDFPILP